MVGFRIWIPVDAFGMIMSCMPWHARQTGGTKATRAYVARSACFWLPEAPLDFDKVQGGELAVHCRRREGHIRWHAREGSRLRPMAGANLRRFSRPRTPRRRVDDAHLDAVLLSRFELGKGPWTVAPWRLRRPPAHALVRALAEPVRLLGGESRPRFPPNTT